MLKPSSVLLLGALCSVSTQAEDAGSPFGQPGQPAAPAASGLRDLSPDRPDTTESCQTVDKGHWQIEASLASYARDKDRRTGDKVSGWSFAETNLKYGFTDSDDLQLVVTPYAFEDARSPGAPRERTDGTPDVVVRWKHNLWGNGEGETGFALMPYATIPSGSALSTKRVEGGLIAPFGWTPDWAQERGLGFGFMLQADAVWNEADNRYDAALVHTATCGIDLFGPVGCFVEYVGEQPSDGSYVAMASLGVTYAVDANLLLDAGTRVGLTRAAEDLFVYTGFTLRH